MTYIRQGNAFPDGDRHLTAGALEGIHIVRKDAGKLVVNFAVVEMVGCQNRLNVTSLQPVAPSCTN